MSSKIDAFLQPQLDINQPVNYAFGAEVARAYAHGQTQALEENVKALKNRAYGLFVSTLERDIISAEQIDARYAQNDHELATRDLRQHLETPLQPTIIEWLSAANNNDIAKFCAWNLRKYVLLQSKLTSDTPRLQEDTLAKVERLTAMDFFPRHAHKKYKQGMRAAGRLKALDTFESGGKVVNGYVSQSTIGIANLYRNQETFRDDGGRLMKRTIFHEYTHMAGRHMGFMNGIHTPLMNRLLEEAFVEHATVVSDAPVDGGFDRIQKDVIDPEQRIGDYDTLGLYRNERTFLGQLNIPADLLADAYFSSPYDTVGSTRRAQLEQQLAKACGSLDYFFQIVEEYEQVPSYDRALYLQDITERIAA